MASKLQAASSAVAPGSTCCACVVASGADLNAIRAILGDTPKFGKKGTLFCRPGSKLEEQALMDQEIALVSFWKESMSTRRASPHLMSS